MVGTVELPRPMDNWVQSFWGPSKEHIECTSGFPSIH